MKQKITYLKDKTSIQHFNDVIGNKLEKTKNYYEFGMLDYIRKLGRKKRVLDIGANIGNHTIFFAKYVSDDVLAVEPVLNNFELLKNNVSINNLEENVKIYNFGLGKENTVMYVKNIERNMGACDLTDKKVEGSTKVEVRMASTFAYDFNLVKIDCESMSFEIFMELLPQIIKNNADVFIEASSEEIQKIKEIGGKVIKVFNATPTYHIKF